MAKQTNKDQEQDQGKGEQQPEVQPATPQDPAQDPELVRVEQEDQEQAGELPEGKPGVYLVGGRLVDPNGKPVA